MAHYIYVCVAEQFRLSNTGAILQMFLDLVCGMISVLK